ncbi:PREDICTED: tetratricopeptide repeat protein 22-like [Branchiostoma belcheri]|uniref:Tetratricopeptide repeat protein 22-like n=1 Tax=Branchiostoma belcheri TaxID=7741 RepID=A0A6P4YCC3_BRABE|nr:PREDICTED: tetratricopeptide repeat protein 22-like [Branchiostoma belcheri]
MAAGGLLARVPTPGFFHLDLFIKDTKDVTPWYDELKRRLEREKGPMESAMTNLLSVFAFHKVHGKGEARKLLEKLTEKDENNLNAIANKQFIYSQLMRAKDEMACRDRLQELLSDEARASRARNARCFAEQAYALTFDVRDDSKDMVSKVRHAISLLETALSLVCDTETLTNECLVWKYYLSICYWRFDQVMHTRHGQVKPQLTEDDRKEGLLKAQSLLIEVTQMNPSWKHSESYIAKAWALLGALVHKCTDKFESYETPDYVKEEVSLIEESQIGPQFGCFGKALEINPDDSEIYRRFGTGYMQISMYNKARDMFDKSIDIMPDSISNWFAYYERSLVNMLEYDQLVNQVRKEEVLQLPSKDLLQRAKQDAVVSCKGAMTPFNVYHLGKVSHRLAIHPITGEVKDKDELDDALDSFAQALQLEDGFAYSKIHSARGWSLEVAGEHEKAAESYKRAVENEEATFNWNLTGVLRNLLKLHRLEDHSSEHYIAELAFWINEGSKKYPEITKILQGCVFKFGSQMIQVCQHLLDHDKPMLAKLCLQCFRTHKHLRHRTMAASMERKILGVDGDTSRVSGADGMTSTQSKPEIRVNIPVSVKKPRHGHEFQYDFFVSHSSKDADWVDFALLPAMEVDLRFKGCVADRDFVPGKSVFDNIMYSIENSYKTLLILTPNFVTSEWCKYETEQALVESLKSKTGRVIPIMLQECDVPASLRTITYLDVSHDAIGSYDWLKLKKALEETPPTK